MAEPVTLFHGRYRVVGVLGRSHYATVYETHDTKTDDRVAVKVLCLSGTHRNIAETMFRKEVGALTGFNHPAVVGLVSHFADTEKDQLGIVLELVPGGRTLEHLVAAVRSGTETPRSLHWRVDQLLRLLEGLDGAHRRHVIHRDVKLANVLVDRDQDTLRLADFGVALLLETCVRQGTGITLREFYTRPFAAPEQILHGEASFAADLHAFGLVAASLLAWQVPPTEFKASELPTFLSPLRNEIRDPYLFQEIETCLAALLQDTPSLRPRTPDITRLLRQVLERTSERKSIGVIFTTTARAKAQHCGCPTEAAILADLNDDLRARYEGQDRRQPDTSPFNIKCYGRGLWAHLVPHKETPTQLVLVNVGRSEPSLHARQREQAPPVPFALTPGNGDATLLIELLFAESETNRRRDEERRKKESLLEVAKLVLSRQRDRLQHLSIRYKKSEPPREKLTEFAQLFDARFGQATTKNGEDDCCGPRGTYLRLQVLSVSPIDDNPQPADAAPPTNEKESASQQETRDDAWTEGLDKDAPFLHDGQSFGTFHAYDPGSKTLTIRVQQWVSMPCEGEIECKDVAVEAVLKRQEAALERFFTGNTVNPNLGQLLLYPERNNLGDIVPLNLVQDLQPKATMLSLVEHVLAARDFYLVQGPPGTGKTTVITEVMAQILRTDPNARILLTSQANEAVNNALEALGHLAKKCGTEWRLLRDVRTERSDRDNQYSVDVGFRDWVKTTRKNSENAWLEYAKTRTEAETDAVKQAVDAWTSRIDRVADVRKDYAESVHVFGVTCLRVPTLWKLLREVEFDWVIVDEAAKATPSEVLVSLVAGRRFVLVGDHLQLPPYLDKETEEDLHKAKIDPNRARKSLFEELFERIGSSNRETLRRQYRMHHSIGTFVGNLFYRELGGLETGVLDSERTLDLEQFSRDHRVFWIDVKGKEEREGGGTSYWNRRECEAIRVLLKKFNGELQTRKTNYTVGVIAAYAAQARHLRRELAPNNTGWSNLRIRVDTVDAFQGKQDDLIIYSLVRVGEGEKRFLSDPRRLNVAFSRAKRLLVLVGHRASGEHSSRIGEAIKAIPVANVLTEEQINDR